MYKPSPSHQKFLDILTEKNRKGFAIGGGQFKQTVYRQNFAKGDYVKALNSLIKSGDTSFQDIFALKDKIEEIVGTRPGGSFQLNNKTYGDLLKNFNFESFATRSKAGDPKSYDILDADAQKIVDDLNKEYDFLDEKGLPKKGVKFNLVKTKQGKNAINLHPNNSIYEDSKRVQRAFDKDGINELKKIASEITKTDSFKNYDKGKSYKNIGKKSAITQLRNDGSKQDLIFDYISKSKKPVGLIELAKEFEMSPKVLKRDLKLLYENIIKKASNKGGAFLPDDLSQLNIVRDKMKEIPDVSFRRDAVKSLVFDAYRGDPNKLSEVLNKVDNYYILQSKIPSKYQNIFSGQLDHIIPMSFLKQVDEGDNPLNLIRVQPVPTIINQKSFKGNFDAALSKAKRTGDTEAIKAFNELQKYLPQEFGGISKSGKVSDFVVDPLDQTRSLTDQQKKFGEIYERVFKFIDNPKVGPLLEKVGINPETAFKVLRGSSQLMRKNLPGFLNTFEDILKKNPELRVEFGDEFADIKNQYASASMMSDVSPVKKETEEPGLPAEAITAGSLYGLKYAPQIANMGKNLIKGVGAPLTGMSLAASEMMSEDPSMAEAGSQLLLPEVFKRLGSKLPKGFMSNILGLQGIETLANKYPKLKSLKPFGKVVSNSPRLMTPTGISMIMADALRSSEPKMLLGEDMEPKTFKREDSSFVMPTMLDISERAYRLSKEKGISYEEAFRELAGDKTFQEGIASLKEKYAIGGRVGFADGPEDPKKRKFMKIIGGLASIPLLGRFIDIGTTAQKAAPVVVEAAKSVPPYFFRLVEKIKFMGDDVTDIAATSDREVVKSYKDFEMRENMSTGEIIIRKRNEGVFYDQDGIISDEYMTYKPGTTDEATKMRTVDEYEEFTVRPDGEGKLRDAEDGLDSIDEILEEAGDTDSMTLKN